MKKLFFIIFALFISFTIQGISYGENLAPIETRQEIKVSDVGEGRKLATKYLKLLKRKKLVEAIDKYQYINPKNIDSADTVKLSFLTTLNMMIEQLGGIEKIEYVNYSLSDVRNWVPERESPGKLICKYKVTYEKAETNVWINLIKTEDRLKVYTIEFRNLAKVDQ